MGVAQFSPVGQTVILACSNVSAEAAIGGQGHATSVVRVYNDAVVPAHIKFSIGGGQTATTADCFIAAKVTELFSVQGEITHITAILGSGTGNVYAIRGGGQ
jgi:hypothetical protein